MRAQMVRRSTASPAPRASAFDVVIGKTLTVSYHGVTREITMEEALQQRTYRDAVAGKRMAQRQVVSWLIKREAWLAKHALGSSWRPVVNRHISPDPDNADAAILLLGIAAPNPARADIDVIRAQLLLEPWAVQAALRRRRGGNRLTDSERADIRRCTREADSLGWPRGTEDE